MYLNNEDLTVWQLARKWVNATQAKTIPTHQFPDITWEIIPKIPLWLSWGIGKRVSQAAMFV